jgi:hypothetical protein
MKTTQIDTKLRYRALELTISMSFSVFTINKRTCQNNKENLPKYAKDKA